MFRPSAIVLVAFALVLTGCGVQLRTPPAAMTTTVTVPAPGMAARPNPTLPPPPLDPLALESGQTVVTLTFDGGRVSNARAAQIMNAYRLRGTFFVNSGAVGKPGHLTLAELDWIATNSGNEIAGNTVAQPELDTLSQDQIRHEVCDDRATLMKWGFPVRNFAYPFGYHTPRLRRSCGTAVTTAPVTSVRRR